MPNENRNPDQNYDTELTMPFVSDEMFVDLTGGLEKSDIHPLLKDMRQIGPVPVPVGEGEDTRKVGLVPRNMENGSLFPQLEVVDDKASTLIASFGGDKFTFTVIKFDSGEVGKGAVSVKEGIQVQSVEDFDLIPESHWNALNVAKNGIAEQKRIDSAAAKEKARKRGGFIRKLFRGDAS